MTDAKERLERQAAETDPSQSAEEKARGLRGALEAQAEESEAAEAAQDFRDAGAAPPQAGDGVAEHEREMARRGFEREGPPE